MSRLGIEPRTRRLRGASEPRNRQSIERFCTVGVQNTARRGTSLRPVRNQNHIAVASATPSHDEDRIAIDEVIEQFPVTRDQIRAVLKFAARSWTLLCLPVNAGAARQRRAPRGVVSALTGHVVEEAREAGTSSRTATCSTPPALTSSLRRTAAVGETPGPLAQDWRPICSSRRLGANPTRRCTGSCALLSGLMVRSGL
jgi:hypothetical protein